MNTTDFLAERYPYLVEAAYHKKELTEQMYQQMMDRTPQTLDELEVCYQELAEAIANKQYYQLIARIEKAEVMIANETDMEKKDRYIKKMKELCVQLEQIQIAKSA